MVDQVAGVQVVDRVAGDQVVVDQVTGAQVVVDQVAGDLTRFNKIAIQGTPQMAVD